MNLLLWYLHKQSRILSLSIWFCTIAWLARELICHLLISIHSQGLFVPTPKLEIWAWHVMWLVMIMLGSVSVYRPCCQETKCRELWFGLTQAGPVLSCQVAVNYLLSGQRIISAQVTAPRPKHPSGLSHWLREISIKDHLSVKFIMQKKTTDQEGANFITSNPLPPGRYCIARYYVPSRAGQAGNHAALCWKEHPANGA